MSSDARLVLGGDNFDLAGEIHRVVPRQPDRGGWKLTAADFDRPPLACVTGSHRRATQRWSISSSRELLGRESVVRHVASAQAGASGSVQLGVVFLSAATEGLPR